MASRSNRVLPGFGLSLGYTLVYLFLALAALYAGSRGGKPYPRMLRAIGQPR